MKQRRTQIGAKGCQTCGCNGCSVEDFLSRNEDPEFKPKYDKYSYDNEEKFDPRNGCCRKCMKAFSKTGKSHSRSHMNKHEDKRNSDNVL